MTETAHIMTTRFNQETWSQNKNYRIKKNIKGCIYAAPLRLPPRVDYNSWVFAFEMNNDLNVIMGIGFFQNKDFWESKPIYRDMNYNRYVYKSNFRIDRMEMIDKYEKQIEAIETLLFKGKCHLKRGQGFTKINEKKMKSFNEMVNEDLHDFCKKLLIEKYKKL